MFYVTDPEKSPYLIFGSNNMILKQNLDDLFERPLALPENSDVKLDPISGMIDNCVAVFYGHSLSLPS